MNYMVDVAKMLGVEIGEEFKIKDLYGTFKITRNGLFCLGNYSHVWKCEDCENKILSLILNGKHEIVKLPILDDVEKRYLSRFIRPWRDKVILVTKEPYGDYEYIAIDYKNDDEIETECMPLPKFKKNTMYKGMKWGEGYSLEELNI